MGRFRIADSAAGGAGYRDVEPAAGQFEVAEEAFQRERRHAQAGPVAAAAGDPRRQRPPGSRCVETNVKKLDAHPGGVESGSRPGTT